MKNAEEWAEDDAPYEAVNDTYGDDASKGVYKFAQWIKQIQLDAWKQGMQDAIESLCIDPTSRTPNSDALACINKRLYKGL